MHVSPCKPRGAESGPAPGNPSRIRHRVLAASAICLLVLAGTGTASACAGSVRYYRGAAAFDVARSLVNGCGWAVVVPVGWDDHGQVNRVRYRFVTAFTWCEWEKAEPAAIADAVNGSPEAFFNSFAVMVELGAPTDEFPVGQDVLDFAGERVRLPVIDGPARDVARAARSLDKLTAAPCPMWMTIHRSREAGLASESFIKRYHLAGLSILADLAAKPADLTMLEEGQKDLLIVLLGC